MKSNLQLLSTFVFRYHDHYRRALLLHPKQIQKNDTEILGERKKKKFQTIQISSDTSNFDSSHLVISFSSLLKGE